MRRTDPQQLFEMADDKKYTPSLRFPEFNSAPGWIILPIGDVADTFSGGTPSAGNSDYYGGTIPFIRSGEIACEKTALSLTEYGLSNSAAKMVKKGTLLYALYGATSGNVAISKIDGAINQAILAIIPKDDKYNNYFIYYFLEYQKPFVLSKYLQGGQGNLSAAIINSIPIAIPCNCDGTISCEEQAKVVDTLLSLDNFIAATKSKLEQLKEHKRGLMQRLFPAKGKTVPELRFTEFRNDGEWEIKKLRDIATFSKGKGISKTDVTANGTTPCIRYGELYTTYKETITDVSSYTDLPVTDLFLSKANDVIIPSSGETKEDIATASCIIKDGIAIGGDINVIRTSNNGIFLSYYLTYVKKNDIARIAQGVSIIHLYNEQLRDLVVELPNSIKEQQRIADCLQSVDNVIKSYEDKITALELHKKGLMQQLFPKL